MISPEESHYQLLDNMISIFTNADLLIQRLTKGNAKIHTLEANTNMPSEIEKIRDIMEKWESRSREE